MIERQKQSLHTKLHSGTWKLRKRKHWHVFGIIYIYYGLLTWLFPNSGILSFPPLVSAIVTKSNNEDLEPLFSDDLSNSIQEEDKSLLLENFGPGTFASPEEIASDEKNDAKLWLDIVESIKEWQQQKFLKSSIHHRQKRDEEVVCYSDVGCFRDDGPFDYLDMLPSPPEEVNTAMMLYTRQNLEKAQFIEYNNVSSVLESNYNSSLDTKIIIHGFGSSCNRIWAREMRLSFLAVEDVNVICVDWSAGAVDPNYVRAAVNTRLVGKQVALLVESINESLVKPINDRIHIVGFSLGAHVAGFAGEHLSNLSRITGLDPAGPLFEGYDGKVRLDKNDANYVDVIHSNGESLIVGGFGTWEAIGHVDFYPNGGRAQRGCQHFLVGSLYDFIYSYQGNDTSTYRYLCNHRRAYKFFTDSISPKCYFTSFPCENYDKFQAGECFSCGAGGKECGRLGYYSDKAKGRGSLYLVTRDEEPFCGTQYQVSVLFSRSRAPVQTYGKLMLMLVDQNGINETFTLTQDVDDLLTSGTKIEKIITVHPVIEPVSAFLLYVAYDGWIFSGRHLWRVDKIALKEGRTGEYLSHCKSNDAETILRSGYPSEFSLMIGDCAVPAIGPDAYFYKHSKKPGIHDANHFPPQINNEPLNALLPPPPPPPKIKEKDEFIMDTKVVQIAEAGEDNSNSIQINDEVAPASVPDNSPILNRIEVWDNLAPNAVPNMKRPNMPMRNRRPQEPQPTSPASSFWPGFLDFFGGSTTAPPPESTPRPIKPLTHVPQVIGIMHQKPDPIKKSQMITLSTKNGTQQQHVTMHHLSSDEQLTILKVDDANATNDKREPMNDISNSNDEKSDYIVLHKLPNGEALNLENLETYASMADVESGIQKTHYHPRALMPNIDYVMPPSLKEMIISERPVPKPELYEPIPLDQLEDLEAMPYHQTNHPVYIINPLKGDLNDSGEILPPTSEEVEEALKQANVELFKIDTNETKRDEKFLNGVFMPVSSTESTTTEKEDPQKQFFETQTLVYDFNWTPMPKRTTLGPPIPPPNYRIRFDNLKELSHLAHVSIPEQGDLSEELRRKNQTNPVINVQVLPARLSSVLLQINEKHRALNIHGRHPGMHRQNKIAPIFKVDPTGLDRKRAKSLESQMFREPPQPRHVRRFRPNPLRRFQTQLVPGSSDPNKYIPLHIKPTKRPKLWWQPLTVNNIPSYATVTIVNHNPPEEEFEQTTISSQEEDFTESSTLDDYNFDDITDDSLLETTTNYSFE